MCELLAMSTSRPARLTFSLHTLASRGGESGSAHDGWGVAFYQGEDIALFREPLAAAGSALVNFLESHGPPTTLAISHIRHATRGTVQLSNTQPFVRELGARMHVFAHNGDLPGIYRSASFSLGPYRPVGQSDSEHAFCALLDRLGALWREGAVPPLEARRSVLDAFAADLCALGPANFLYADGDALFAHGHRRLQRVSRLAEAPGLWWLQRECAPIDQADKHEAGVALEGASHSLLIASVPLTDDPWQPMTEGELVVARSGRIVPAPAPPGCS